MRALRRRGLDVAGLQRGPDHVDPTFQEASTGRRSVNLDFGAMDPALVDALGAEATADADMFLCEGLKGLFDGVPAREGEGARHRGMSFTMRRLPSKAAMSLSRMSPTRIVRSRRRPAGLRFGKLPSSDCAGRIGFLRAATVTQGDAWANKISLLRGLSALSRSRRPAVVAPSRAAPGQAYRPRPADSRCRNSR